MPFGAGRISLLKLLRQGQVSKTMACEVELYENVNHNYVGSLQVLIEHQGR